MHFTRLLTALFLLMSSLAVQAQDNSCRFANDNECDEPRYFGTSGACLDGTDTNDCRDAQTPEQVEASLFSQLSQGLRTRLGDNSCSYARDNECDDAQFGGSGSCALGTDAADCRALALGGDNSCQFSFDNECDEPGIGTGFCANAADRFDCEYVVSGQSDDSCQYANDNECDEPRYGGGACRDGTDMSDCATIAAGGGDVSKPGGGGDAGGLTQCVYANDNECDEARYGGTGLCEAGTDSADCSAQAAGDSGNTTAQNLTPTGNIGGNSCQYANDNECDEARYGGGGYCEEGTDSFDCALIVETAMNNNSCEYANDNECDEPRFFGGTGACRDGSDSNDCAGSLTPAEMEIALFQELPLSLQQQLGDNSCTYARDNECDDAQFGGTGSCEAGTDAVDCRALALGGDDSCEFANDNECDEPGIGTGACINASDSFDCQMITAGISDDSCQYANDNECDEPRYDADSNACRDGTDTSDCQAFASDAANRAVEGNSSSGASLDSLLAALPANIRDQLGNDSCTYADDGECDDFAFGGTGACDAGTDARDCRLLASGGDDSCQWANDGECDEPGIGSDNCMSGSDVTDCAAVAFLRNRSDECSTAFDGTCDEPENGTGNCAAYTDTADCLGRGRPAEATGHFFGRDDRFLPDTTALPWRAIGMLELPSGSCTGTLIGPRHVLTAAHCLTDDGETIALPTAFYAGLNDDGYMETAGVTEAMFAPDYSVETAAAGEGNGNDWGLVTLDQDIGNSTGFLAVHRLTEEELRIIATGGLIVSQAGYSWDTGNNMSGHRSCRITQAFDDSSILHECDTLQGDSGSPFMIERGGEWHIVAVESQYFGAESKNSVFSQGNLAVDSRAFAKAIAQAMGE